MKISRRNFLTKVSVGIAGFSLIRDLSWAQAKAKLGYMKIVDNASMFMAMEKGFFKAEGLELETVPLAGGAPIINGVTSGDLQFGWSNVISLYQAHVEGFDFKLIAGGATNVKTKHESHAIQVAKNSPIKTAKDRRKNGCCEHPQQHRSSHGDGVDRQEWRRLQQSEVCRVTVSANGSGA